MKTLKDHLILYDAECPMCKVYTGLFVKTGMLDSEGRQPYQQMQEQVCVHIDRQRAVNEIALINTKTGHVSYGIHSLFKVIGNSFPVFKGLFTFPPFVWLTTKFYAFISYNRKVIIPAPKKEITFGIQPTFKVDYRIAYLVFTVLTASYILSGYSKLFTDIIPVGSSWREYIVCGGQLFFQGTIMLVVRKEKLWEYLGNMMTISFAGSLLLLPVLLSTKWVLLPQLFYALYFMFVAGLMLLEHARRSALLGLGWTLTISWVLYRIIILLLILQFK